MSNILHIHGHDIRWGRALADHANEIDKKMGGRRRVSMMFVCSAQVCARLVFLTGILTRNTYMSYYAIHPSAPRDYSVLCSIAGAESAATTE